MIATDEGVVAFSGVLVKRRAEPVVRGSDLTRRQCDFCGGVLEAIRRGSRPDLPQQSPDQHWADSAVRGVREALRARRKVCAVCPSWVGNR